MSKSAMTKKERVAATLARKPVDRLAVQEAFWSDTQRDWTARGWLPADTDLMDFFDLEIRGSGWLNGTANLKFAEIVVAEDEDTKTVKNGNYATLRWHKKHSGTPEHVAFDVAEREAWERLIRPNLLELDKTRIPFEGYRNERKKAAERQEFFTWNYVAPFEQLHPVCGHEYMLMGMIDDPAWIHDMVKVFTDFSIKHADALFAAEGEPDGIWFFEDMGFKDRPFMSPDFYREFFLPAHKRLCDWAHSKGKPVIMHSCGFVEPLVPGMIEAGIDCLQVIEVKAGMSLPRLAAQFSDRIAFCGGLDVREIISNDKSRIDKMLDTMLVPALAAGASVITHSDHSIPNNVHPDTLRYFIQRCREIEPAKKLQ